MEMQNKTELPLALPVGTVLAGKYVISQALGQGGFGITYVAEDYKTKEKVAIKEFFPDTMVTRGPNNAITIHSGPAGENFVYGKDCFLEEAKTLAEFIGNENIVRVISYFEENGTAYFVMEYIEGESFQDYIKSQGGKVSWEDAQKFLIPVMDALAAVHSKGIVHRDVPPDNIYITQDGVVKLLDFGAARYSLGDKSRSLDVVLKHGFAPKEQYTRHGKQGPFTDVYTVGASFYFALTGKRPPDAIDRIEEDDLMPPTSLGIAIPPAAEDAILKALNIQPAERFQDMTAFKNALLAINTAAQSVNPVQGTPVQEVPVQTVAEQPTAQNTAVTAEQGQKTGKKVPIMIGCAAGVIVVLLGTIIALLAGNHSGSDPTMVVADNQSNSSVLEQPASTSDNVIVGDDAPVSADVQEDNNEAAAEPEEEAAAEDTTEDAAAEEPEEDDPYSYDNLGYDYENEMSADHEHAVYYAGGMTWDEAFRDAADYNGYLARINSEREMKKILKLLDEYKDDYNYIYVGGARDSQAQTKKEKKTYCWIDYDLGFMEKQNIAGPNAEEDYEWLSDYWLHDNPSYKDNAGSEQVLEFIKSGGKWWLNDVSDQFPYQDNVSDDQKNKIGYLIEYEN